MNEKLLLNDIYWFINLIFIGLFVNWKTCKQWSPLKKKRIRRMLSKFTLSQFFWPVWGYVILITHISAMFLDDIYCNSLPEIYSIIHILFTL